MAQVIALVVTDMKTSRLGLDGCVAQEIQGHSVLACTLHRLAQIPAISRLVVLHPADQDPSSLVGACDKPIAFFPDAQGLADGYTPMRQAARKWSRHSWRGGLGGMTCYDLLLPAKPLLEALKKHNADTGLLVGGDWPLVDPQNCQRCIERHLESPEGLQLTFTQSPPGLCGIALSRDLLEQLARNDTSNFGGILSYNPSYPQADPIGRDLCVQISPAVRNCNHRLIYDTPQSIKLIQSLAADLRTATADQIVTSLRPTPAPLPEDVTLELTPRRQASGPLLAQHHVTLDRPDMSLDDVQRILEQLDAQTTVSLGGLGDAMLHPQWDRIVQLAADRGVLGVALYTDLLVEPEKLDRLLQVPLDVLCVRINADTAAVYEKVMNPPMDHAFKRVTDNLQWVLNERNRQWQFSQKYPDAKPGIPWIVPSLVKTHETLKDMETFFDRWMHFTNHAVIAPATTGCGLMPALSPVKMASPKRKPCRQLDRRMSLLSDGTVALCDQDWLGRSPQGSCKNLPEAWSQIQSLRQAHQNNQWDQQALCAQCIEWHRP